jgi:hypothetical protein
MLLVLAIALLVPLGLLLLRGSVYRKLFARPHFSELAAALAGLKQAALVAYHAEGVSPGPSALGTSAGLAVLYSISSSERGILHHCSVSQSGGPTPHAVGGTFLAFTSRVLGLAPERGRFLIGPSGVHHGEWLLSAQEHAALAAEPTRVPAADELESWVRGSLTTRDAIQWQRPGPLAPH